MSSYAVRHPEYGALLDGRSKTDGTRATLLGDDTRDYQKHVQREFLFSSAVSDRWVRSTGRALLAAPTLIEAIAPCRAGRKGDPHEIIEDCRPGSCRLAD